MSCNIATLVRQIVEAYEDLCADCCGETPPANRPCKYPLNRADLCGDAWWEHGLVWQICDRIWSWWFDGQYSWPQCSGITSDLPYDPFDRYNPPACYDEALLEDILAWVKSFYCIACPSEECLFYDIVIHGNHGGVTQDWHFCGNMDQVTHAYPDCTYSTHPHYEDEWDTGATVELWWDVVNMRWQLDVYEGDKATLLLSLISSANADPRSTLNDPAGVFDTAIYNKAGWSLVSAVLTDECCITEDDPFLYCPELPTTVQGSISLTPAVNSCGGGPYAFSNVDITYTYDTYRRIFVGGSQVEVGGFIFGVTSSIEPVYVHDECGCLSGIDWIINVTVSCMPPTEPYMPFFNYGSIGYIVGAAACEPYGSFSADLTWIGTWKPYENVHADVTVFAS